MKKQLRSGFTTGACAAAAAKAATQLLLGGGRLRRVEIGLPGGDRVGFSISDSRLTTAGAAVTIIKDAGDDPDVTDGAKIIARVQFGKEIATSRSEVLVTGGPGVGIVTKPGLPVGVGEPAINPVPHQMIRDSVAEAVEASAGGCRNNLVVTICVPEGERLAEKTLNRRLGIVGGISILGTTGIVKPISTAAWTATITASLKVADANRCPEVILATGRTSELVVGRALRLPEEAMIMMGDYLVFTLEETSNYSFTRIHLATMWGKLLKGALGNPQTHVRHGSLDLDAVIAFFENLGARVGLLEAIDGSNTAREVLDRLLEAGDRSILEQVCSVACERYRKFTKAPVTIHLVHTGGTILHSAVSHA